MAKKGWHIGLLGEVGAILVALFDKRTPLFAKILAGLVLIYLVSPFDFLPDIIPFIGWVDDAAIVPLGLWLASRFIPPEVMDNARQRFARDKTNLPVK
jgi:uncharacterized membrane protein YkvA (DUF1232 family)